MKINKAYKVELKPNNRQRTLLARSTGCARFAYNWGLARRIELYKTEGRSTSAYTQHKELCAVKKSEYPWMYEVTKCAPQEALRNLDTAFKNFFRRLKFKSDKPGFPRFKSKHKDTDSFKVTTGAVYLTKSSIKLPNIKAPIKLKEVGYIPLKEVKYNSYTVSKRAGKWFLSVQCEVEAEPNRMPPTAAIGVDLGIKELATVSDGRVFSNPKALSKLQRTLNRKQRERCRRVKGSANRRRTIGRMQKVHYKVSCVRKDSLHKMTTDLVKTKPNLIVLEDLSVKNMLKNHKLARSLSDASFAEARRQIEYKAKWAGIDVVVADRFFPSSKKCSKCGAVKEELKLSDRIYRCSCGHTQDRDLNAAINLKRYGELHRSLSNQKACGEERLQRDSAFGGALSAPQRSKKKT